MNNQEKEASFLNAINKDAQQRCDKIKADVDRYISSELQNARKEAQIKVREIKKTELGKLAELNNAEFAAKEAEENKKLFDRRAEITDKVFDEAKKRITAFTESEKYLPFLVASVKSIFDSIGSDATVYLRREDSKFEADLSAICSKIVYTDEIKLGGCKGESADGKLTADDTLEARLATEKEKFYSNSGLKVSL